MIKLTLKRDPVMNVEEEFDILSTGTNSQNSHNFQTPKLRLNLSNIGSGTSTSKPTTSPPNSNNFNLPHSGLEEQFILRLPPSLASILKAELSENEYASPGDLSIKFISPRTAIVKHPRFIKEAYGACLFDSPTIMETFKSSTLSILGTTGLDEKEIVDEDQNPDQDQNLKKNESDIHVGQYYKVADLNQILMVLDLDTIEGQRVFNRIPLNLQEQLLKSLQGQTDVNLNKNNLFNTSSNSNNSTMNGTDLTASWAQWPDGLTGPMKLAKQKRFSDRPWHASSIGELERIEKEVERLLKSDGQAIDSKFTLTSSQGEFLLGNEEESEELSDSLKLDLDHAPETEIINDETIDYIMEETEQAEEEQTFRDEDIENASDIEDMNDFVAEIEDNLFEPISESKLFKESEIDVLPETSESDRLVRDLEGKLAEKLKQAESVSNPLIKARIEDVIRQLEDNLKHLRENK